MIKKGDLTDACCVYRVKKRIDNDEEGEKCTCPLFRTACTMQEENSILGAVKKRSDLLDCICPCSSKHTCCGRFLISRKTAAALVCFFRERKKFAGHGGGKPPAIPRKIPPRTYPPSSFLPPFFRPVSKRRRRPPPPFPPPPPPPPPPPQAAHQCTRFADGRAKESSKSTSLLFATHHVLTDPPHQSQAAPPTGSRHTIGIYAIPSRNVWRQTHTLQNMPNSKRRQQKVESDLQELRGLIPSLSGVGGGVSQVSHDSLSASMS